MTVRGKHNPTWNDYKRELDRKPLRDERYEIKLIGKSEIEGQTKERKTETITMSNSRLFIFDQYQKDSIKLGTREGRIRSTCPILRVIEGGSVPLPRSWPNFLALPDNKSLPDKVVVAAGGF